MIARHGFGLGSMAAKGCNSLMRGDVRRQTWTATLRGSAKPISALSHGQGSAAQHQNHVTGRAVPVGLCGRDLRRQCEPSRLGPPDKMAIGRVYWKLAAKSDPSRLAHENAGSNGMLRRLNVTTVERVRGPHLPAWLGSSGAACLYRLCHLEPVKPARFRAGAMLSSRALRRRLKKMLLSEFQNGLCFYCDTPLGNDKTVDEFIPRALSGVREMRNSVVCHHDCNNAKGCRMPTSKEAAKLFRTRAESDRFPISQEIKNLAMPALAREQKRAAGS